MFWNRHKHTWFYSNFKAEQPWDRGCDCGESQHMTGGGWIKVKTRRYLTRDGYKEIKTVL